jgi:hypothetical protein
MSPDRERIVGRRNPAGGVLCWRSVRDDRFCISTLGEMTEANRNSAARARMTAAAVLGALALSGCAGGGPPTPIGPRAVKALKDVHVDPVLAATLLTRYRASHGLGPVRLDPALAAMAQKQADAMAARNDLSHEVAGAFPARLKRAGLDPGWAGENVGGGYYSTGEALAGWRASPEHNANMLNPQATRFGVALAKNPATRYRAWWALELAGEPAPPPTGGPFATGQPLGPPAR